MRPFVVDADVLLGHLVERGRAARPLMRTPVWAGALVLQQALAPRFQAVIQFAQQRILRRPSRRS